MKKRALHKDSIMEIKSTFSRYLSLLLIVALGVAFFSGIRAAGPDMRLSADRYYDDSVLMDIRVVSKLGLTEGDMEAIAAVDGVGEVMPAYSADVLCDIGERQEVVRILSLPDTINQMTVEDGRMPEATGECVVDVFLLESGEYKIGDVMPVYAPEGEDIGDTLHISEFTIVGCVSTPYYLSFDRGTSSIGSGSVYGFAAIPAEDFSLTVYTEAYATVAGVSELAAYTGGYEDAVSAVAEEVEAIAGGHCQIRYDEVMEEGRAAIADAEVQMADAEAELAAAGDELVSARQELEDARAELDAGARELADGWAEYGRGAVTIEEKQAELDAGRAEWQAGKKALEPARAQLDLAWTKLAVSRTETESGKKQLQARRAEMAAGEARLAESRAQLEALQAMAAAGDTTVGGQIAELEAAITAGEAELDAARPQLDAAQVELDAAEEALIAGEAELAEQETRLSQAESELDAAAATLAAGQTELNRGKAELEAGRQELFVAEAELAEGRRVLADAEAELTDGEAEFFEAQAEGETEITDAKIEIADARAELEELKVPEWYVLDRQSLQNYVEFGENADRIEAIGVVFPLIFFIVAALVCLTTMTRMVEERRTQIGCLKALGYGRGSIAAKYIFYALSATLLGSLIGLVAGQKLLPMIIVNLYKSTMYQYLPKVMLPLDPEYSVTSTAAAVLCITAATVLACYREMRATPARLMRPASPKAGKRIFLERVGFIWRRLNFSGKATARNLFRYKKRFLMTLFGIGGCMALILVGFGLKDSISSIGDLQYTRVQLYDSVITVKDDTTGEEKDALLRELLEDPAVEKSMLALYQTVDVSFAGETRTAVLLVPKHPEELEAYISLQDRKTGERHALADGGAVITEKLAALLDASAGDAVALKEGEAGQVEAVISEVSENYIYHYVYMTPSDYEALYGSRPVYNTIMTVDTVEGEAAERAFQDKYMGMDAVSAISLSSDSAENMNDVLSGMDVVVYVLIVSAGLLAFIVLYNLNNINISERSRELATLKVLGFYDIEVSVYVIRENVWLTAFGAVVGVFLGIALHRYVIQTAEVDIMMFGRDISPWSFALSAALTFAFSGVVNLVMHFRLRKINMVESMKSVE